MATTRKTTARKFVLTATTYTRVGKRQEETYLYKEVNGTGIVRFYASNRAFEYVGQESEKGLLAKLTKAFTNAGLRQHEVKGGFDAAIAELSIKG